MVAGFRRSISFPGQNPSSPGPKGRRPPEKVCHVRSTSLPCRSHPAIAGLEDEIRALRAWLSLPAPESGSPTWISTGLARIDLLHASLDDLLHVPQAQDTLRRHSSARWTDRLLDDFLRFADAYGSLRSTLMSLKQTQSELHTAIRRRDEARLASSLRSQKRIEKDLAKLAVSIREASRSPAPALAADAAEVELAGIMREVTAVSVAASAAVFLGIGAVSSTASAAVAASTSRASYWVVAPLRKLSLSQSSSLKKRDWEEWDDGVLERLEALEECIEALESKSERVFRSLVNTRVLLLNILTPSL
ncbi:uncharacterized protein [Elaeis guineensis]|uniref:Uncharacterized protein LOC105055177 n=1 Tax=Elaeis guineensis var. tenera TaxID=51953 RepID=A0A6I9S0Y3_ELAGV|nr:uncharacterized protein LOC105055177 [Elaeis guineensis]